LKCNVFGLFEAKGKHAMPSIDHIMD